LRDLTDSRLQCVDLVRLGGKDVARGRRVLLEAVHRHLRVFLAHEELALGLQLIGVDPSLHGKFAVGTGEEDGILETEWALLSNETLVSFIGKISVVQLFIFLELLGALGFLVLIRQVKSWVGVSSLGAPFFLVTQKIFVGFRMNRRGVARDLKAAELAASLTVADVQVS